MGNQVALCVDEVTCQNPALIGLDGELLEAQTWLDVFASGEAARKAMPVATYGTILCLKYNRDTTLIAELTFITTLLSMVSIPMLVLLMRKYL